MPILAVTTVKMMSLKGSVKANMRLQESDLMSNQLSFGHIYIFCFQLNLCLTTIGQTEDFIHSKIKEMLKSHSLAELK